MIIGVDYHPSFQQIACLQQPSAPTMEKVVLILVELPIHQPPAEVNSIANEHLLIARLCYGCYPILGAPASTLQPRVGDNSGYLLRHRLSHIEDNAHARFLLGSVLVGCRGECGLLRSYIVDIFVQMSGFRELWQRSRWLLFAIGTTFAVIVCFFPFASHRAKRGLQGCGRSRSAKKRSRHCLAWASTAGYSADLRNAAIAGSSCR